LALGQPLLEQVNLGLALYFQAFLRQFGLFEQLDGLLLFLVGLESVQLLLFQALRQRSCLGLEGFKSLVFLLSILRNLPRAAFPDSSSAPN
jgi:hypothetical protein